MNILHVIPSLSLKHGGPTMAILSMARSLVDAGVCVDVAATDDDGPGGRLEVPLEQRIETDGMGVYYFQKRTEFYKLSPSLARWLSRSIDRYDLVHVHGLFSHASCCAPRRATAKRKPCVITPHGMLNSWGMRHRRPFLKFISFRCVEKPNLYKAAAVHYTSQMEKAAGMHFHLGVNSVVIPLGIDQDRLEGAPSSEIFREAFPTTRGKRVILFLSRIDKIKGLDLLLDAFASVAKVCPNAVLVIAGEGERSYLANLKMECGRLGISEVVLWTGFLGGVLKSSAFASADVFVLPSYSENFGVALLEALCSGCTCIVTDRVGLAAEVGGAEAAFVIPPTTHALANTLRMVLQDENLRTEMGARARAISRERFTLPAMGGALKRLYEEIVTANATQDQPLSLKR